LDFPRTSGRDVKLSPHDLRQLDDGYLQQLPEAALRVLSSTLLADLKEAQERLQQNPSNSSRPPSSRLPWDYLATAIADRRAGLPLPPLPQPGV
jgi:transposase